MNSEARPYRSPVREEQARRTEQRITAAALELFLQHGYTATTVAAVAERAEVSAQTVYNVFGSKGALLTRIYNIQLVGDHEQIDPEQRQQIQALDGEVDAERIIAAYAQLSRELAERLGPLQEVLTVASASDEQLAASLEQVGVQRLFGAERVAHRLAELAVLAPGLTIDDARDRLYALSSVELWQVLYRQGWSAQAYQEWITETMRQAVLG